MLFGLNENQSSIKGFWIFAVVYIGSTLLAAMALPFVYWMVQYLDANFTSDASRWLAKYETDVYFDRIRWVGIIIGLPWAIKKCGLFSLSNLGLSLSPHHIKTFLKHFFAGACLAICIFILQIIFTDVTMKDSLEASFVLKVVLSSLLSGLILGFLEELVMRGLILRCFYTAWGPVAGIVLSSLFFAYKHFKVPSNIWDMIPGGRFESAWDTGFYIAYYDTVGISYNFNFMIFMSLTMFGMFLGAIYIRTKTLMAPMAAHAGIVMCILSYRKFFDIPEHPLRWIFGNAGMTNGLIALVLLSIMFCAVAFCKKCQKQ